MSQRRIRPVLFLERCFKYFNMDITQAFDFFGRQALFHQRLLHLGDFGCLHPADQLTESLLEDPHVFSGVQGLDNFFECRLPLLGVSSSASRPLRRRFAR